MNPKYKNKFPNLWFVILEPLLDAVAEQVEMKNRAVWGKIFFVALKPADYWHVKLPMHFRILYLEVCDLKSQQRNASK